MGRNTSWGLKLAGERRGGSKPSRQELGCREEEEVGGSALLLTSERADQGLARAGYDRWRLTASGTWRFARSAMVGKMGRPGQSTVAESGIVVRERRLDAGTLVDVTATFESQGMLPDLP